MKTIIYGFQFQHHGKYTSFWGLSRYLTNYKIIDVSLTLPSFIPVTVRSILFKQWLRINEYRLFSDFKSTEPKLFHYYHPENSIFHGGRWKNRHKLVLTCHQPISKLNQMYKSANFAEFFDGLSKADAVIVLSTSEQEKIKKFSPQSRIIPIHYGVETEYFKPNANRTDKPVILTVGNWLRDYQCWAKVINDLSFISKDIRFVVVANKNTILAVKKYLGKTDVKVDFYSGVSDVFLINIYHESSLFFLPLFDAVANNSLLEAMACGLPIITRDLPAVREYLGESSGILIEEHQPINYVNAIVSLLHDPALRYQLGNEARRRAENEFSWRVIAEKYQEIYQDFI